MKPVTVFINGKLTKRLNNFEEVVAFMNRKLKPDKLDASVTMRLPEWLKEELRERKKKTGVAMSKQALAYLLKGTV